MRSRVQCLGRGVSKGASGKRQVRPCPSGEDIFSRPTASEPGTVYSSPSSFANPFHPYGPPRPAALAPASPFALLVSPGDDKEPITVMRKKLTTTSGYGGYRYEGSAVT